eukprot:5236222-Pyramimonas_sp.AAC.1
MGCTSMLCVSFSPRVSFKRESCKGSRCVSRRAVVTSVYMYSWYSFATCEWCNRRVSRAAPARTALLYPSSTILLALSFSHYPSRTRSLVP